MAFLHAHSCQTAHLTSWPDHKTACWAPSSGLVLGTPSLHLSQWDWRQEGCWGLRERKGEEFVFEFLQKQQRLHRQQPAVFVRILLSHVCQR